MTISVLDACALIAVLRGEPGANVVRALLLEPRRTCVAHVINLCEVYYDLLRATDATNAQSALNGFIAAGLIARADMDTAFWQAAGTYKATLARVSLADCFALALTHRVGGTIVTSDHREFDPIAALGVCPVQFIR